jgi:hypothetical protein
MAEPLVFVGIDVSKATLDVAVRPAGTTFQVANDPDGLSPYFFADSVRAGLAWSVVVTLLALFEFGYVKGRYTSHRPFRSAWQTLAVGGLAAAAAFLIAKLIGG